MSLPLSKTLNPSDLEDLAPELGVVDQHFTKAKEQNHNRRWEYSLALRAQTLWYDHTDGRRPQGPVVDVGGGGSPFWRMINPEVCRVVDPAEHPGLDLAEWLRLGAQLASEVYCLSVLEHVSDLDQFLFHLACLVAPGGLLFLTMDCWDLPGPDTAHFHWMRKRIFTPLGIIQDVLAPLQPLGFSLFGAYDPRYYGNHVYNYSFASLALIKRA